MSNQAAFAARQKRGADRWAARFGRLTKPETRSNALSASVKLPFFEKSPMRAITRLVGGRLPAAVKGNRANPVRGGRTEPLASSLMTADVPVP
jgi:hypothetical protein